MPEFTDLTVRITQKLSKTEKKENGIFITPRTIIHKLFTAVDKFIDNYDIDIENVLEPSCGTCEMIQYMDSSYSGMIIDGVELNQTIFQEIKEINFSDDNRINLVHSNFLEYNKKNNYDLIIGNPPYVVCEKDFVPTQYQDFIVGRPNLFGIFILHSLSLLKSGGILAFIIPKSFMNSFYYSKIRDYIKSTCTILSIIDFEKDGGFIDTQQSTFGLIIRKTISPPSTLCNYSFKFHDTFMFTENAEELKTILEGSTTLRNMGLSVKTGTIVWNQHKEKLTDDQTKTLLLYNSNISGNKITMKNFSNGEKKQYINMTGNTTPVIVVNRGNGNSTYVLSYAFIDLNTQFLVENHLNFITSNETTVEERNKKYNIVLQSFKNPKTEQFIKTFLGNNGLSKTELETIFPIYT